MKLITDPKEVTKLAQEQENANWKFRAFLKGIDLELEELDAIVHKHYEEVSASHRWLEQLAYIKCSNQF